MSIKVMGYGLFLCIRVYAGWRAEEWSHGHLEAVKLVGKYILSTMNLGLQFSSKPNSTLESLYTFHSLTMMLILLLLLHLHPLIAFAMQTGDLKMHPNHLPLVLGIEAPAKLKLRQPMNVLKIPKCFVTLFQIYNSWTAHLQPVYMIRFERLRGIHIIIIFA